MRNLKRVLSLSLASVMLFGMMVVGASAAVQGYPDVDDEDNVEAIDVLQTIQVMIGDDEGFRPDDPVTRAEMMVIMAKLLELDYNYYAATCPFTDVPEWARGYVGAAYANKVAYGRGDGIFDPNSTITPVEASAFLMRALGYFQYSNDYSDGFELATVRQGTSIGIYDGVSSSASEPMTRNQVAQMVLNTLKSGMVQPDGNTINLTTPDGTVLTGKVNYVYVTSSKDFAVAISDAQATNMGSSNNGVIVEMGEQLYNGKLKLNANDIDVFGRPSRHWEYDGETIGDYVKKELIRETYTAKVTGKALYELLGSETIRDYVFSIRIDGEKDEEILNSTELTPKALKDEFFFNTSALKATNTNALGGSGNGTLTQVFVDGVRKEVYISMINTYLAKADADYNARRDEASFTIYNVRKLKSGEFVKDSEKDETLVKAPGEEFDVEDIKSDDIVMVYLAEGQIQEILEPEVITETTISSFKLNNYVVAEGAQYDYATTARYSTTVLDRYAKTNMKETTYRIYLDLYGYLIGIKILDKEVNYLFLTGINSTTENLKDQNAVGNVIFLDGTSATVTIDMKNSKNAQDRYFSDPTVAIKYLNAYKHADYGTYHIRYDTGVSSLMNTWCTYSVDANGVYTLREVANTGATVANAEAGQSHVGGTYLKSGQTKGVDEPTYYLNNNVDPTASGTSQTVGGLGYTKAAGADDEYVIINKSHVELKGIPDSANYKMVYGNKNTVYLTAETDIITANRTLSDDNRGINKAVIITGADSVTTGVNNVDLQAYNAQQLVNSKNAYKAESALDFEDVSNGVYVLFEDDGYVVAAMVVGAEDSSYTYAWVSSTGLDSESLVDGKWHYSRDLIVKGVEENLTEVESIGTNRADISHGTTGKYLDPGAYGGYDSAEITNPMSYWLAVKTKGDGTVNTADPIKWSDGPYNGFTYIYDINSDTRKGTVILNQAFNMNKVDSNGDGIADVPDDGTNPYIGFDSSYLDNDVKNSVYKVKVTGSTLQVEGRTGKTRGFFVDDDATIAVVKDEQIYKGGKPTGEYNWKTDIEYFVNGEDASGLKQAVNYLNDNTNFVGYIAAEIKDGHANSVIIYDKSGLQDVEIGISTTPSKDIYVVANDVLGGLDVWYKSPVTPRMPQQIDVEGAITAYLKSIDYDVIRFDSWSSPTAPYDVNQYATGSITLTVTRGGTPMGTTYLFRYRYTPGPFAE